MKNFKVQKNVSFREDVKYIATKWMPDQVKSYSKKGKLSHSDKEKICRDQTFNEVKKIYQQKQGYSSNYSDD